MGGPSEKRVLHLTTQMAYSNDTAGIPYYLNKPLTHKLASHPIPLNTIPTLECALITIRRAGIPFFEKKLNRIPLNKITTPEWALITIHRVGIPFEPKKPNRIPLNTTPTQEWALITIHRAGIPFEQKKTQSIDR